MVSITLDKTDLKIPQVLQENGRLINVEFSGRVALSPSLCLRRFKQLEDVDIIRKYTALLSPVTVEPGLQAFIRVSISKAKVTHEEFSVAVQTRSEVLSCFAPTSEIDYLLHTFLTGINVFLHFVLNTLLSYEGVQDAQPSSVLKEIKSTTVLSLTYLQHD